MENKSFKVLIESILKSAEKMSNPALKFAHSDGEKMVVTDTHRMLTFPCSATSKVPGLYRYVKGELFRATDEQQTLRYPNADRCIPKDSPQKYTGHVPAVKSAEKDKLYFALPTAETPYYIVGWN
jgi:hypothetical protein